MIGADLLIRELQARGVRFIAVLCGNGLDPLLTAAARAGLRLVDARNEQAGSYTADAYARLTRRVGVCAVSSGVAHVNALAGVLNAHFDGAPLLLISGASNSFTLGRGAFQDLDQVALARPICAYAALVTRAEKIPQAIHEAFAAATAARPAPVHLTIPMDVLNSETGHLRVKSPFSTRGEAITRAAGDTSQIAAAAQLLAEAHRPVIVAGSGVFFAQGGQALEQFARLTRIPVVTPIWDRGVIDRPIEEFLGVIGAATGEPRLLTDADVILLAGARVDYRVRFLDSPPLAEGVSVIRCSVDAAELQQGFEPHCAILADCRTAFEQLSNAWEDAGYAGHQEWLSRARRQHWEFYSRWAGAAQAQAKPMTGAHIVEALRSVITPDTIFLVDGGTIGQWAHLCLCRDRYPSHWLTCGASGVVGWGVPGAIAARLAFPDSPVILLSGDGAVGFGIAEFESAVRQKIPFVAVVADDQAWGITKDGQRKSFGYTVASELGPVDYAQVAKGVGARAVHIGSPDEIATAVREGIDSGWPTLIQVPITSDSPGGMLP